MTEIVIVAALGQRPTLSYHVYLSLSEEPTGLHVLVHERQPGSDEDQLTAISYPTVLAIVRTDAIQSIGGTGGTLGRPGNLMSSCFEWAAAHSG